MSYSAKRIGLMSIVVYFIGVLYYCFAYLLRVYTGIVENHILETLNITASGFGVVTSFYYFAYAPLQVPVGVCVDKFGPRRSLLVACFVATLGAYGFAEATSLPLALFARFWVGFGCAFAYVTALKLAAVWLPRRYFATATGGVTALGMVAAILTDNFLTEIVAHHGAKSAMTLPVYVGIVLFLLLLLLLHNRPRASEVEVAADEGAEAGEEHHAMSFVQLRGYLKQIVASKQLWLIGLVGALLYLPSSVFLDTWAIPYLKVAHGLSPKQAAHAVSLMFFGWIISSLSSGFISDWIGNRRMPLLLSGATAFCCSIVLLYAPGLSVSMIMIVMFCFGVCCGPHPLCFTLSKENSVAEVAGTSISFVNFIIMMGGFVFQPVVGKLLDVARAGRMLDGRPLYLASDFHSALLVMPIGLLLSFVLIFFIKETYHSAVDK